MCVSDGFLASNGAITPGHRQFPTFMTKPTAVGGDPPVEDECLPLDDISNFTTGGFGVAATIETTVCGGSGSMYFDIAILDTVCLFRMTLRGVENQRLLLLA